ncbi:hypothetical protein [Nonomuraea diastatica]|uniref:Uncharacterized protein n=1 Tax=Nonomuraea diastatica TaxID=1848329 RepID=A0A4R4VC90_9ACTN|nr:hypothetical protein [Nonomuraea diastatica]TDD02832.1 hypothetical protein E1294_51030 [Nonomuraea diastatica]
MPATRGFGLEILTAAYASTVRAAVAVLIALNEQINSLEEQVEAHLNEHPNPRKSKTGHEHERAGQNPAFLRFLYVD